MTTTTETKPFDAYVRVSDVGDRGENLHSPTDQLEDIVLRAPSFGIASIDMREYDEDVSGRKAAEDRKLEKLIRRIETGQSGGIVTAYLDRFGRDLIHGSLALKRIIEAGGRLVCVNDGIDSDAPGAKLNIQMRLAIAEEYLDRQTLGFNRSSIAAVKAGKHVGAHVPAGYSKDANGRLSPNGDTEAIREAFERRARGDSMQSIARFLTKSGVRPGGSRNDGWSRTGVQTLLANRTYLGETRGQRELDRHGRKGDQFVNPKAHEPLVSEPLFAKVQAMKGQKAIRNGKLAEAGILGGLVTCEACGHKLRKKSMAGDARPVYACARYYGKSPCPAPATATLANVDNYVRQAISFAISEGSLAETVDAVQRRKEAESAVERAERELDELADLDLRRSLGKERHTAMTVEAKARLQTTRAALHEIEADGEEEVPAPDADLWGEHWTTDKQRRLARALIAEVTLAKGRTPARERVEIRWAGQDDFDHDLRDRMDSAWFEKWLQEREEVAA